MISLPDEAELAIRAEGERAYPDECCGALLGGFDGESGKIVKAILPIGNSSETAERFHRFTIGPGDFMRAEREAKARNMDLIGFYHSHPDHPAEPSDYDLEHALPFYSYVIVAVEQGAASGLTSWEMSADRARFLRESQNQGQNLEAPPRTPQGDQSP
ncbi:MAG: M67 family metallopeptidase [Synergistaceae bacterium]|jgi:proteasome lid subunit RPN8/RPN11|nr:M67 family metallopeptidase [Synergistaceae bacterium]